MPKRWTTNPQKEWLTTKIPGFVEARGRGRSKSYAKGIHASFSEMWPEKEALFGPAHAGKLKSKQETKLVEFKRKRGRQILSWLQRNSTPRGRGVNRIAHLLIRKGQRRRRVLQPSEIYGQLYPDKVKSKYEEVKVPGQTKGERLNFIKKIADELLDRETEDVKAEVELAQTKQREDLNKLTGDADDSDESEELEENTRLQYINELPQLLTSVLTEIIKFCPEWGFLLLASGPMPHHGSHVFDLYCGPKSVEGYSFPDAVEDFDSRHRIPFGKFVQECRAQKTQLEESRKALDALKHKVSPGPEDENSGKTTFVDEDGNEVFVDDSQSTPQAAPPTNSDHASGVNDAGNKVDEPDSGPRAPPLCQSDVGDDSSERGSDDEGSTSESDSSTTSSSSESDEGSSSSESDEGSSSSEDGDDAPSHAKLAPSPSVNSGKKKAPKHALEVLPLADVSEDDEDLGSDPDEESNTSSKRKPLLKEKTPNTKKVNARPTLVKSTFEAAAQRDEATKKRLETRSKNKAEKAALKAQQKKEEEARKAESKKVVVKGAGKVEKGNPAAKSGGTVVNTMGDRDKGGTTKAVEEVGSGNMVDAEQKERDEGATKVPTRVAPSIKQTTTAAIKPKATAPPTTRRPAPSLVPTPPAKKAPTRKKNGKKSASPPSTSKAPSNGLDEVLEAPPPDQNVKKSTGRKHTLEGKDAVTSVDPNDEHAKSKRPRRNVSAPKRADEAVPFTPRVTRPHRA